MSIRARLIARTSLLDRGFRALTLIRDEIALGLLDNAERQEVTARIYARLHQFDSTSHHTSAGFYPWELDAIRRFFPAPPARILVGGCGGGREVFALVRQGYEVAAYDPVVEFVDGARNGLNEHNVAAKVWRGTHEDLSDVAPAKAGTFDGVLVGWSSYGHVSSSPARRLFLKTLRSLSPNGPVLISFVGPPPEHARSTTAMVRSLLRAMFARIGSNRDTEPGDRFESGNGYIHYFTESEIREEASSAGYRVLFYADGLTTIFPNAVLAPNGTQGA